jgi:hypothetical protein
MTLLVTLGLGAEPAAAGGSTATESRMVAVEFFRSRQLSDLHGAS